MLASCGCAATAAGLFAKRQTQSGSGENTINDTSLFYAAAVAGTLLVLALMMFVAFMMFLNFQRYKIHETSEHGYKKPGADIGTEAATDGHDGHVHS